MDPERQWISRLEPEVPEEKEELDEAPLARVPRLVAGGTVAVGGALELLGVLDDWTLPRIAVLAVVALVVLTMELIGRLHRANLAET